MHDWTIPIAVAVIFAGYPAGVYFRGWLATRFRTVDIRFDAIDKRLNHIEQRLDRIEERLERRVPRP